MLIGLASELGPWSWLLAGLVLLAAELLLPGVFLVWIGIGAIVTGILSLLFWETSLWVWQLQSLMFAALSLAAILAGRRLLNDSDKQTDEPLLNQRSAGLVGRTATLHEPMTEGRGRVRLDDINWPAIGPDLPVGARVRVVSSNGQELTVTPV
ncbi:MAG: NfeD family protein [Allorhizobium sp.]